MADDTSLERLRRRATELLKRNVPTGLGGGKNAERSNADNRKLWLKEAEEGTTDKSYSEWIKEKRK